MGIINPKGAGVDIDSRSYLVVIRQGVNDFQEFGVFNTDLCLIVEWCRRKGIQISTNA